MSSLFNNVLSNSGSTLVPDDDFFSICNGVTNSSVGEDQLIEYFNWFGNDEQGFVDLMLMELHLCATGIISHMFEKAYLIFDIQNSNETRLPFSPYSDVTSRQLGKKETCLEDLRRNQKNIVLPKT